MVPLSSVAKAIRGTTFKPDDVIELEDEGAIAVFRTKNIQTDLDFNGVWGLPARFADTSRLLQAGDLLISTANSAHLVGKVCWVPHLPWPAVPGGFIGALRADAGKLDARYLYWWARTPNVQASIRTCANQTTNIANLSIPRLMALEIPLPHLDEQRRIATILDQADGLRTERRASLQLLAQLPATLFNARFGDPILNQRAHPTTELLSLVDPARPITYGILKPGPDLSDGIPYVRVVDMKAGGIEIEGIRRTSKEIAHQYRRSTLRSGDLLISIRGHVGRTALTPEELDGANITQDTARLAITGAHAAFVRMILEHPSAVRWMSARTRGAAVQGINLGDLKRMPIILPNREEQNRFAVEVAQIGTLAIVGKQQLAQLDALFASLQHRAFSGELTRSDERSLETA